jgi:small subunit ribosomal protein S6
MNLYEGMFLLDNQVVRADWKTAKSIVVDILKKHGGEVVTVRRWDERKLAYPIRGRRRGTFYLTFFKAPPEGIAPVRHDLDLDERVLRYLMLRAESVSDAELELSKAELADGFTVPPPPSDDEVPAAEEVPVQVEEAVAEAIEEVPAEANTEV